MSTTTDLGELAQQAAQAHIDALNAAEEADQAGETGADWPDTAGPWCGCQTCLIREVLFAAMPILQAAAEAQHGEALLRRRGLLTGANPPTPPASTPPAASVEPNAATPAPPGATGTPEHGRR